MKRWQLMLVAWFLFIGYLLAGAFMFRAIELAEEKLAEDAFFQTLEKFLASHPCVSRDELFHYSQAVVEGANRGVVDFNVPIEHSQDEGSRVGAQKGVWDLSSSFFFSATIVTTIGYGDITPQTSLGRFACVIYAAIGLPLTAWVIGVISKSLTAYWTRALDKADKILLPFLRFARLRKTVMVLVTLVALYAILLQVPALVLSHIEQWDVLTAVYYLFITLTTIGFGDLVVGNHPDFTQSARWVLRACMVLYVILGLSLLLALSSAIAERANKAVKKSLVPGNSYRVERTPSKKLPKRVGIMLQNEIALSDVPELSSARMTDYSSDFHIPDAETLEMRSLSNHIEDVLPGYEEVVIGTSEHNDTVCIVSPTESSELAKSNGHISIISKDEYGRVDFTGPSIVDHA